MQEMNEQKSITNNNSISQVQKTISELMDVLNCAEDMIRFSLALNENKGVQMATLMEGLITKYKWTSQPVIRYYDQLIRLHFKKHETFGLVQGVNGGIKYKEQIKINREEVNKVKEQLKKEIDEKILMQEQTKLQKDL